MCQRRPFICPPASFQLSPSKKARLGATYHYHVPHTRPAAPYQHLTHTHLPSYLTHPYHLCMTKILLIRSVCRCMQNLLCSFKNEPNKPRLTTSFSTVTHTPRKYQCVHNCIYAIREKSFVVVSSLKTKPLLILTHLQSNLFPEQRKKQECPAFGPSWNFLNNFCRRPLHVFTRDFTLVSNFPKKVYNNSFWSVPPTHDSTKHPRNERHLEYFFHLIIRKQ